MKDTITGELTQLGLNATEAQIYLTLIQNGPMGASAVAAATGLARTSVYPALGSLVDKGVVDAGEGYASRFSAVPADRALPHLMAGDKESLLQRERLTSEVIERISLLEERPQAVPEELIQVIRNPRAVAERLDRLQLEAEHRIEVFSKAPVAFTRPGNPTEEKVLRRGLQARSVYESAILDDPAVKPFLAKWIGAGEQARVYQGELPHKLAIFDSKTAVMPLMTGKQVNAVFIQHRQLVQTLSAAFEYYWERSNPLVVPGLTSTPIPHTAKPAGRKRRQRFGSNSSRSHPSKK